MARRGVFKIINRRTGRVYVGSSNTNLDRLIYSYWQRLYAGDHHNYDLQSDFDYYGRSNFTVESLVAVAIQKMKYDHLENGSYLKIDLILIMRMFQYIMVVEILMEVLEDTMRLGIIS